MSGEHIIQQSTILRGQGYFKQAAVAIEDNIDSISGQLHATAWREALTAAREMGDRELMDRYKEKLTELEAHVYSSQFVEEHIHPHPLATNNFRP